MGSRKPESERKSNCSNDLVHLMESVAQQWASEGTKAISKYNSHRKQGIELVRSIAARKANISDFSEEFDEKTNSKCNSLLEHAEQMLSHAKKLCDLGERWKSLPK